MTQTHNQFQIISSTLNNQYTDSALHWRARKRESGAPAALKAGGIIVIHSEVLTIVHINKQKASISS